MEVYCHKCDVLCILTEIIPLKTKKEYYNDSCWNCGTKFPLIPVKEAEG